MKIVGREKLGKNEKCAIDLPCGTVFRYENGSSLFMTTVLGIISLEDGCLCTFKEDEYLQDTPVKVVNVELHIISEEN